MGNTSSSSSKITSHDKAILQLKLQRDKLNKSKQKIQIVIDRENVIAKECIKNKQLERAKLTLRKKKRQESLLSNLEKQSNTLEELIDTIEFKLIEKDVLYGLEQGNAVLKEINSEMSVERVDRIMEDSADAIMYQQELSDRLGSLLTNSEEEEVEDELRRLEMEMGVGTGVEKKLGELPSVPKVINKKEEEEVEGEEDEEVEENVEEERVPQLA